MTELQVTKIKNKKTQRLHSSAITKDNNDNIYIFGGITVKGKATNDLYILACMYIYFYIDLHLLNNKHICLIKQ